MIESIIMRYKCPALNAFINIHINRCRCREIICSIHMFMFGVTKITLYKYRSQINNKGIREYLGTYTTVEMAARIRDYYAIKYYGEFANLNFPESRELYKF